MKIAIITAMWRRPHVFDLFGINTNKLISECSEHEIQVFVAGSEGDTSRSQAHEYDFNYIEHPNQPLYAKFNAATRLAGEWHPNYVMVMGSDDIMDLKMLRNYYRHMDKGVDLIGSLGWYFYDINKDFAYLWNGYAEKWNKGMTCGAGRMLSRKLMEALNWEPWQPQVLGEGMDRTMERRLKQIPHTRAAIAMGEGMGLGINSEVNITNKSSIKNTIRIPSEQVKKRFILP